jgi:hypothetical protein
MNADPPQNVQHYSSDNTGLRHTDENAGPVSSKDAATPRRERRFRAAQLPERGYSDPASFESNEGCRARARSAGCGGSDSGANAVPELLSSAAG